MKRKIFFASGAVLLAAAVSFSVYVNNGKNSMTEFFNANVDALAQNENSADKCDSGNCGRCFEEETAWPFYKCTWTGVNTDFCDCNKLGYL